MTLAAAAGLGALAGVAFAWLWLRVVPWAVHLDFWAAMPLAAREVLGADEARVFFGHYRGLLALVARYVGRNLGGALVASLPVLGVLLVAERALPGGEVPFFAAFMVAMMAVFLWPALRRS